MLSVRFLKLDVKFPYPDAQGLRLTFVLEFMNHFPNDIKIWDMEGIVYASSALSPKRYYLGRARPDRDALSIPPNVPISDYISLDITYDQLEMLEKIRDGSKLRFELILSMLFTVRSSSSLSTLISAEFMPIRDYGDGTALYLVKHSLVVMDAKSGTSLFEIDVGEWLDILSRLNFKHVRIIEVPRLPQTANKHLEDAVKDLDKAMKLMLEDSQESLNACRKALEDLKEYIKDYGLLNNQGKIDFEKIYGGERFGEAMDKIFSGLWTLTDIGSHTGRSKIIKRDDIEFIITTTYMLLKTIIKNTVIA